MHRFKKIKKEEREKRGSVGTKSVQTRPERRRGRAVSPEAVTSPPQASPAPSPSRGGFPSYLVHLPLLTPLAPLPPRCLSFGLQMGIFGGEQTAEQGEGTGLLPGRQLWLLAEGGGGASGRRGVGALGLKFQHCTPVVFNVSKSATPPRRRTPPPPLSSFLKLHHLSFLGSKAFRNSKAKDLGRVVFVFCFSYIQWVFFG